MLNGTKVYAIIGAAGSGKRMAAPLPKQFLTIDGKTILEKTVQKFLSNSVVDGTVIVTGADYMNLCRRFFAIEIEAGQVHLVTGGQERQDSIYNGLKVLHEIGAADSIVLIHDGVRPYVSTQLITAVVEKAKCTGAAIPAVPPKDTIRHNRQGTLDRSQLFCVQTPQAFQFALIERAYEKAAEDGFYGTDDASLVERLGQKVSIVPGEYTNLKITTPEDLQMETRIGTGYDVHRLTEDRKLILGGVEIPHDKGLDGHSDADVLVHALMDAMLGAAALGDIGKLFPDTDEAYHGISSLKLLAEVGKRLAEEGYSLGNADVTVVCQRPKLAPFIGQMCENIAKTLKVPESKISIKATTTEKLGFAGRGEGIAAEAVCLLNR
ncbi:2-C-methyl-D-erythritol 4-phosphate cytidylyltransferase [Senimuribacter intestinalis]|uniref:2-C-methyl-D-erythritol 4-phosphate cytidylyltransferase n=1 Tax=Senimuribacter intestinalis TaxID=2941507 RepID=UPI00203A643F|nr:2-C-methyl-D-erythritol 4-phosphate cytidylyltransferase [Senimuribacter intestinalis]